MPLFPVFSFRLLQSELFNVEKVTFYCDVRAQLSGFRSSFRPSLPRKQNRRLGCLSAGKSEKQFTKIRFGTSYKKASNSSLEITYLMVNIGFYKLFIEIYTGNSFKLEDNTCTVRISYLYLGVILNTGSVSLFSRWNLENSIGERISGYLLASYPYFVGYRRGAVAYFNKSVDKYINLTNRLLRRFYRGFSNDLENVRNSLLCVIILSNNPCQKQR